LYKERGFQERVADIHTITNYRCNMQELPSYENMFVQVLGFVQFRCLDIVSCQKLVEVLYLDTAEIHLSNNVQMHDQDIIFFAVVLFKITTNTILKLI